MNKYRTLLAACLISVFVTLQLHHQEPMAIYQQQGEEFYTFIPTVISSSNFFVETFDGDPTRPLPWKSSAWDIAVHSRDISTWDQLEPMQAMHGEDCSPPPAMHLISSYEDAVYLCRNHLMTAINAGGYGVIYLTPNRIIDFSHGEAVIRFDVSTERTSQRDWIDIWITPYEDNLQLPLQDWLPDLSGEPRRAVSVKMNVFNGETSFGLGIIQNFQSQDIPPNTLEGYESVLTPSSMKRDTFELRISKNHIKFGMPNYNLWWIDTDIPALDWTQGVVQFGHHSYNPTKDCTSCGPNTWHWDNVMINPSVPFSIISAHQRFASEESGTTIDLSSPALSNGHLRFSGVGENIEVSFDNGKTWQKAQRQVQETFKEEAFISYWMPIPVNTKQVKFRGQSWWGGEWRVKDISVWSR